MNRLHTVLRVPNVPRGVWLMMSLTAAVVLLAALVQVLNAAVARGHEIRLSQRQAALPTRATPAAVDSTLAPSLAGRGVDDADLSPR